MLYSLLTAFLSPSPSSFPSRLLLQDNKEGSSCAFTCNDGYHMSAGSATRKCTTATSTSFDGTEVICSMCPIGKYKDSPTTCATLISLVEDVAQDSAQITALGENVSQDSATLISLVEDVAQDSARITALESTPVAAAVPSSSSTSGASSANTGPNTTETTAAAGAAIDSDRITALESMLSMAFVLIGVLLCLVALSVCMLVWMYKEIKKMANQLQRKVTPGAEKVNTPHTLSEDV